MRLIDSSSETRSDLTFSFWLPLCSCVCLFICFFYTLSRVTFLALVLASSSMDSMNYLIMSLAPFSRLSLVNFYFLDSHWALSDICQCVVGCMCRLAARSLSCTHVLCAFKQRLNSARWTNVALALVVSVYNLLCLSCALARVHLRILHLKRDLGVVMGPICVS